MSEWIKCSDRLPEDCDCVLVWVKGFSPINAALNYSLDGEPLFWRVSDWDESDTTHKVDSVTHWMPLPEPPNE